MANGNENLESIVQQTRRFIARNTARAGRSVGRYIRHNVAPAARRGARAIANRVGTELASRGAQYAVTTAGILLASNGCNMADKAIQYHDPSALVIGMTFAGIGGGATYLGIKSVCDSYKRGSGR